MAAASILMLPLVIIFCLKYIEFEDPVYLWDFRAYWMQFQQYGALISEGGAWFRPVLGSIRNDDYNASPVILLYPFYYFFGGNRESYVIAIALFYLLPAVAFAASLGIRVSASSDLPARSLAFVAALTYLPFWAPTLRGMVDIVGLVFLGLATVIVLKSNFLTRRPILVGLILGVVLWSPFLLRRWYAYSVVGFFVASYMFGLFVRWRDHNLNWPSVLRLTGGLFISALVVAACVAVFQTGLAIRALTTSYADLYSAYQMPFSQHIEQTLGKLGWYVVVMIFVGVLHSVFSKNIEALFLFCCAILTFFLFTHTQGMGLHHFLPVAFWLFPLYFVGVTACIRHLTILPYTLRIALFAIIAITVFVGGIAPIDARSTLIGKFLVPAENAHPLRLENINEYRRLISDLKGGLQGDEKFVVWASSPLLSDELLSALEPSLDRYVIGAPHIANRDFLPLDMIGAQYAITSTPTLTHLAPGSQRNITIPAELLVNHEGFGASYEKIGTYTLANNVTGYLFKRVKDVNLEETVDVVDRMIEAYPEWKDRFRGKTMAIPFQLRRVVPGDVWGQVRAIDNTTLFLHPGATTPTIATIPLLKESVRPTRVNFSLNPALKKQCPLADGVEISIAIDGDRVGAGQLDAGGTESFALPPDGEWLSISIANRARPDCDHVIARFEF